MAFVKRNVWYAKISFWDTQHKKWEWYETLPQSSEGTERAFKTKMQAVEAGKKFKKYLPKEAKIKIIYKSFKMTFEK